MTETIDRLHAERAEAQVITERAGTALLNAMNLLCLAPIKPTLNRLLVELQG